jgi:hypothetical protein
MERTRNRILENFTVLFILTLVVYLPASSLPVPGATRSQPSLSSPVPVTAASSSGTVGSNVPIVGEASPDRQQVETAIAIDPRSQSVLVAGAQDLRLKSLGEHRWNGYYRSTDSGQSWTNSLIPGYPGDTSLQGLASPLHRSNATSDPVLAFDRLGDVYYAGLVFNISASGPLGNGPIGNLVLFVAKYTNDGATYSGVTLITGPLFADKPWIAVDNTGGTYDGNVYVAFDASLTALSPFATLFTRSSDGGKSFSPPFYAPSDQTGGLPGVVVDPAGNVYVSSDAFDPITGVNLNYTQVSKITNGGTTLVQNVRAVNPAHWVISGSSIGASFRAFTIPQIAADAHGVYLVFDDTRLGNSNVYVTRSTDGGSSWSIPVEVNDVLTGQHFFPTIVASGGIIDVAWYDSRFNTASPMTSLDVFFADSLDGGVSFSASVRVTNVSFNPGLVKRTDAPNWNEPFMGDYLGIAASSSNAYPIWTDNRFACDTIDTGYGSCVDQDAFTAAVALPDFALSVSPLSQSIVQGASGSAKVSLSSLDGFQGNVTVSVTLSPIGLPISPGSMSVKLSSGGTGSFNLTFSPSSSTAPGTYNVNITGASGPRSHLAMTSVAVLSTSVGGSLVSLDRLGLFLKFLAVVIPTLMVVAVGTLMVWHWSRRSRKGSTIDRRVPDSPPVLLRNSRRPYD